jgi:predicted cupin superfamily sugar epimerase/quercetin dioxygenase-like cupin family protein
MRKQNKSMGNSQRRFSTIRRPLRLCIGLAFGVLLGPAGHADPAPPGGIAGTLIRRFHMAPIPQEGAWFGVTYTSNDRIDGAGLPARYGGQSRRVSSAIVALETPRDFSALHRLQSDEVWHFYSGTPLTMLLLYPDGHGETVTLGANVGAGQLPQVTVPRGVWQGSMPRSDAPGTYAFFGTQVSPGFESADFEIGYRDELRRAYPAFAALIGRLTRAEFAHRQGGMPAGSGDALQGAVIATADVAAVSVSAGVELKELVGRVARDAQSANVSVAEFTLAPGHGTAASFNRQAEEVFLVTAGSGHVRLGERVLPVMPDSSVFIPARVIHAIEADAQGPLSFVAISAPAFTPEDYVLVR